MQAAVDEAGAREERTRSLPSKLMMYLAMALRLEPGKGYVRTLRGLLDGLRWSRGGWDGYRVPGARANPKAYARSCGPCSAPTRPCAR